MPFQYRHDLKQKARDLRSHMTHAEQRLWFHLRRKQLLGVQFFRQRPISEYIVDFYAPAINLVIEVDGGQHAEQVLYDRQRTEWLKAQGYRVLRFWNNEVLANTDAVAQAILDAVKQRP